MLITTDSTIVCPSGKPDGAPITLDIRQISGIESRIQEIQALTKEKAPELLATFTCAWKDLHQHMVMLTKELNDARRHADRVKGRLTLDEIPELLQKRGLASTRSPAGSADLREAMLSQSSEYNAALERIDAIAAVVELLKGKLIAFDMAYTSIKKIISEASPMYHKLDPGTRV